MATLGNLLVLHALRKASSITATLKQMFLSLALCDLGIRLISHPMLTVTLGVMLNMAANGNANFDRFCPSVVTIVMAPTFYLVGISFFTISAIAVDRLLAVSIHLRYQELVTEKRVGIVLALWRVCALSTFLFIELPGNNDLVAVIFQSVGLFLITVAYFCIYEVVRYHQNEIHGQNQIQNGQALQASRVKKSALNTFYIYIISLACFTPNLIAGILQEVDNSRVSTLVAYNASAFLVLLNSSLNSLVYCWRYREVRNIVKNTVKKILSSNQID